MNRIDYKPSRGDYTSQPKRIAFVGNYIPSRCGIATFTADLAEALAVIYPEVDFLALPTSDPNIEGVYPERVRFIIEKDDIDYYHQAAYFLNMNRVDLVCLQHEYGIFGGDSGQHVISLLRELHIPVITTLHTVLRKPTKKQAEIFNDLITLSDRLIVMTNHSMEFLHEHHNIPHQKMDRIPHGIPDMPFIDPSFHKDHLGVEGKHVLLTFGLLSANKGIEYVIQAMPAILEKYPNVVYIVLGATHPNILRSEGERYRESLEVLAEKLGVKDQVLFHNRYVSLDQLVEYISAADIYITPYLNAEQAVSGTLSYAVGAGKAVISTPYWHAEEVLAEGRGLLVPFKNSEAIAEKMLFLLDNEVKRHTIRKRAYLKSREMVWDEIARKYMTSFRQAREVRRFHPQPFTGTGRVKDAAIELPSRNLSHLRRLTDDTGIFQHAIHLVPRYDHGYTTDDNSRALIASILLEDWQDLIYEARELASRYLAFLWYAINRKAARFRNFMSYDRQWLDDIGSEDCHGRAIWALGTVIGRCRLRGLRDVADHLFQRALPATRRLISPRAKAFVLRGVNEYLKRFSGDLRAAQVRERLINDLISLFEKNSHPDWTWFEDSLTYSNALLPHALLVCGPPLSNDRITQIGLESLEWLAAIQTSEQGYFIPVGNSSAYRHGEERPRFDQQPIDAYASVSAYIEAYNITGNEKWRREARKAFDWFLGRNDLNLPLYDPQTGGCRDGLHPDRLNQNEGAESTVAFLLALLEISSMEQIESLPAAESGKESDKKRETQVEAR